MRNESWDLDDGVFNRSADDGLVMFYRRIQTEEDRMDRLHTAAMWLGFVFAFVAGLGLGYCLFSR